MAAGSSDLSELAPPAPDGLAGLLLFFDEVAHDLNFPRVARQQIGCNDTEAEQGELERTVLHISPPV